MLSSFSQGSLLVRKSVPKIARRSANTLCQADVAEGRPRTAEIWGASVIKHVEEIIRNLCQGDTGVKLEGSKSIGSIVRGQQEGGKLPPPRITHDLVKKLLSTDSDPQKEAHCDKMLQSLYVTLSSLVPACRAAGRGDGEEGSILQLYPKDLALTLKGVLTDMSAEEGHGSSYKSPPHRKCRFRTNQRVLCMLHSLFLMEILSSFCFEPSGLFECLICRVHICASFVSCSFRTGRSKPESLDSWPVHRLPCLC